MINMLKDRIFAHFLLFLYLLYYSQGILYPNGTLISKLSLITILIISLFYILLTFFKKFGNRFLKLWSILLLSNVISYLIYYDNEPLRLDMMKNTLISMTSLFPFYIFASNKILSINVLKMFFLIFTIIMITQFFKTNERLSFELYSDNVVNNISYIFVLLIPTIFLFKNLITQSILLCILLFFIIIGNKRGAFLSASVASIIYLIYIIVKSNQSRKFVRLVYAIFFSTIIVFFYYKIVNTNDFIISRLSSIAFGDSSGRDVIYKVLYDKWTSSDNIWNIFFGFGFANSIYITGGHYAHNDWLELLSSLGLYGIILYTMILYTAFKYARSNFLNIKLNYEWYAILAIWILSSFFSMWYTSMAVFTQSILIANLFNENKN